MRRRGRVRSPRLSCSCRASWAVHGRDQANLPCRLVGHGWAQNDACENDPAEELCEYFLLLLLISVSVPECRLNGVLDGLDVRSRSTSSLCTETARNISLQVDRSESVTSGSTINEVHVISLCG